MAAFAQPHYDALTWGHGQSNMGFGNITVVDKVPANMLHMVDPHWYQFPPMNPLWHAILGFTIGVLGVVSIAGNFTNIIYLNILSINFSFIKFF